MITYKDKTWCSFDKCVNHYPSKCGRVLTDYDLEALRSGEYMVSTYAEKPDYFKEVLDTKGGMYDYN